MQKKEDNANKSKVHNWTLVLVVLIISAVFVVIISNDFSSVTGSAVRSQKKPDLVPYGSDMQIVSYTGYGGNGTKLLANIQVGTGVGNIGTARAKESVLVAGMQGDSVEGVTTTTFIVDITGTYRSAQTKFYSITNWYQSSIEIGVNALQPGTGEGFTLLFMNVPIGLPSLNGTPVETKVTLYGIADASSVISESNENNNNINKSYIFHFAYWDPPVNSDLFCCVKRVDPLSTRYTDVRYCEDYRIY